MSSNDISIDYYKNVYLLSAIQEDVKSMPYDTIVSMMNMSQELLTDLTKTNAKTVGVINNILDTIFCNLNHDALNNIIEFCDEIKVDTTLLKNYKGSSKIFGGSKKNKKGGVGEDNSTDLVTLDTLQNNTQNNVQNVVQNNIVALAQQPQITFLQQQMILLQSGIITKQEYLEIIKEEQKNDAAIAKLTAESQLTLAKAQLTSVQNQTVLAVYEERNVLFNKLVPLVLAGGASGIVFRGTNELLVSIVNVMVDYSAGSTLSGIEYSARVALQSAYSYFYPGQVIARTDYTRSGEYFTTLAQKIASLTTGLNLIVAVLVFFFVLGLSTMFYFGITKVYKIKGIKVAPLYLQVETSGGTKKNKNKNKGGKKNKSKRKYNKKKL
jgi:hypothetical protein